MIWTPLKEAFLVCLHKGVPEKIPIESFQTESTATYIIIRPLVDIHGNPRNFGISIPLSECTNYSEEITRIIFPSDTIILYHRVFYYNGTNRRILADLVEYINLKRSL